VQDVRIPLESIITSLVVTQACTMIVENIITSLVFVQDFVLPLEVVITL